MWNVVFSTGLVYLLYIQLGGCLFMFLEAIKQLGIREVSKDNVTYNFTEMRFVLLDDNFTNDQIDQAIEEFSKDLYDRYFDSAGGLLSDPSWTYTNAFFFAFHLVSTIGYGNISPSTALGQMMAVLYATIGIPLHIITFKFLGESFARSYQESILRIIGEEEADKKKKILGDLGFFIPWTIVFFIIPSIIFMFTEQWNFIEGLYYSFITLSTIGLGDYIAGNVIVERTFYVLYNIVLLCWVFYGLAFVSMLVDLFAHQYQMHLLFVFKFKWRKCQFTVHRIYVDIEKLDIHFRLLRSEGVKHKFSVWGIRRQTARAVDFQTNHLANLSILAESLQLEILRHLGEMGASKKDAFPAKGPIYKSDSDEEKERKEKEKEEKEKEEKRRI